MCLDCKDFLCRRFTIHTGWQRVTDHWKLKFLISRCASKWRNLVIKPVQVEVNTTSRFICHSLGSLQSLRVHARSYKFYWVLQRRRRRAVGKHALVWVRLGTARAVEHRADEFESEQKAQCQSGRCGGKSVVEMWKKLPPFQMYGTGGKMLACLTKLLSHFTSLQYLALRNLQLDTNEAGGIERNDLWGNTSIFRDFYGTNFGTLFVVVTMSVYFEHHEDTTLVISPGMLLEPGETRRFTTTDLRRHFTAHRAIGTFASADFASGSQNTGSLRFVRVALSTEYPFRTRPTVTKRLGRFPPMCCI